MEPEGLGGAEAGPRATLEVVYGRLYPLETPRLRLRKVEGVSRRGREELFHKMWQVVQENGGRECIYEVCEAVRELLKQHHDPAANLPLYEQMQLRQQAQAEEARREEQERREMQERKRLEERDRLERQRAEEREKLVRYQEARESFLRFEDATRGRGGSLDFLPLVRRTPQKNRSRRRRPRRSRRGSKSQLKMLSRRRGKTRPGSLLP